MRILVAAAAAVLALSAGCAAPTAASPEPAQPTPPTPAPPTLLARAILPSDAYQQGPPSGALVTPNNGVALPFPGQPIPGFSAILDAGNGEFWAMPDNGYGAKDNSADFLLRLYRIAPDFRTAQGGSGRVDVREFIKLRDSNNVIPFPLTRPNRLLTGADFDLESVRQTADGTFSFGEEFGPFLLHVAADGTVLAPPVPLPGVQSPQNPHLGTAAPNLPASRGFEGMALSEDGRSLYPWLEGALTDDPNPRRRVVNEFDPTRGAYVAPTPRATSRRPSCSTCSRSPTPTVSHCRPGRESSAWGPRSPSRCSRWRASRSSTANGC